MKTVIRYCSWTVFFCKVVEDHNLSGISKFEWNLVELIYPRILGLQVTKQEVRCFDDMNVFEP